MGREKVVVCFSGGQDSTTCLLAAKALHGASQVYPIAFRYGQRHEIELTQAKIISGLLSMPLVIMDIPVFKMLGDSELVTPAGSSDIATPHHRAASLPASFVPGRNALFLTIAHSYAQKLGAEYVYTGVSQTDYSGYPDCREGFIKALSLALNMGYECDIDFVAPLLHLNKAETFELASHCGGLDLVLDHSHTCYEGDRSQRFDWGYGCANCPACKLREIGYKEFLENKEANDANS